MRSKSHKRATMSYKKLMLKVMRKKNNFEIKTFNNVSCSKMDKVVS